MKQFARPLFQDVEIEAFLTKCLDINRVADELGQPDYPPEKLTSITARIRDVEAAVANTDDKNTLEVKTCRALRYREPSARTQLQQLILRELITLDRLDNDEDIQLGTGGAKPSGKDAQSGANAYLITGLPASGKSSLVNRTSDALGAYILDSDFAKRKLPEFGISAAGANLVHKESSHIVFGSDSPSPCLFKFCASKKLNIVIPTVGNDYEDLVARRTALQKEGYNVHLTTTILPRQVATFRAFQRFEKTGRYVPLSLVFDGYANDPTMAYYQAMVASLTGVDTGWASIAALCTKEANPKIISQSGVGNPVDLLKEST